MISIKITIIYYNQQIEYMTRHLIQMGGLVVKAKLDYLPANSLLVAFVSLQNELTKHPSIQDQWTQIRKNIFDQLND